MLYNYKIGLIFPFKKAINQYYGSMEKLTETEINRRLVEWRNLKVLHQNAIARNKKLVKQKQAIQDENMELQKRVKQLESQVETLQLQIAELREIVFGRRKKTKDNPDEDNFPKPKNNSSQKPRSNDSYQREIPGDNEITDSKYHAIEKCPRHQIFFQKKKTVIFYEEDISLPDADTQLKKVIQHTVEKGYCSKCKKWHSAIPVPSKRVIIGKTIKLYIVYLSILLRLTFEQIQNILIDTYRFKISDGEIRNILFELADKLRPEFEKIKKRLQQSRGVHLDETSWSNFYLWIMAGIDNEDVLFLAGRSRGKGNAEELLGNDFHGIRISDAYPAYKNVNGIGQQCWSHPHTKLEQLAQCTTLNKKTQKYCYLVYENFSLIYEKLRNYIKEPFVQTIRAEQKKELLEDIKMFRKFHKKDPVKIKKIRQQFYDYENEWLTCMDYEGIPCDNNKAERKLRHFVIKRKISFGNKSAAGHKAFEVNASVLMTYWKTCRDSFFPTLANLCA